MVDGSLFKTAIISISEEMNPKIFSNHGGSFSIQNHNYRRLSEELTQKPFSNYTIALFNTSATWTQPSAPRTTHGPLSILFWAPSNLRPPTLKTHRRLCENDDILWLKSVMVTFQAENHRRCLRLVGNCLKTPISSDFRLNYC